MPINRENLIAHEIIGLQVVIEASSDPTLVGVAGTVRDETKNTFRVETKGRVLTVPKVGTSLLVESSAGVRSSIEGARLAFRPEDRIKRGVRNR